MGLNTSVKIEPVNHKPFFGFIVMLKISCDCFFEVQIAQGANRAGCITAALACKAGLGLRFQPPAQLIDDSPNDFLGVLQRFALHAALELKNAFEQIHIGL
ncbi:hypothetical protein D3C85_1745340 [compost metagenome]